MWDTLSYTYNVANVSFWQREEPYSKILKYIFEDFTEANIEPLYYLISKEPLFLCVMEK